MTAYVFVDEFGTPALDVSKEGNTPYFVYAGVVINECELQKARDVHRQIVDTYFQGTHIKSNNIRGTDRHNKTINILSELSKFNHYVTALLVDKSKITGDGLEHKRSFEKFFTKIFDKQFLEKYQNCHIFLDETGTQEFQDSFKEYMNKLGFIQNTLFNEYTFGFKNDISEEPLIQLADFYAGCVGRYYCGTYERGQAQAINDKMKSRLFIDWFPREYANYFGASAYQTNDFCLPIIEIAITSANDYLEGKTNDEIGCEIVRILLQESHINPLRLVSSGELRRKLNSKGIKTSDPIPEVGRLRNGGVLIISPRGGKGYKFPCNEHEIAEHYDRVSNNVIPQLKRAHILHKVLTEQSVGKYNILGNYKFSLLNSLVDQVVNNQNNPF